MLGLCSRVARRKGPAGAIAKTILPIWFHYSLIWIICKIYLIIFNIFVVIHFLQITTMPNTIIIIPYGNIKFSSNKI